MSQLSNSILQIATPLLCISATTSANSTVIIDPNDYVCGEELKSEELGYLQVLLSANKKSDSKSIQGEWLSKPAKYPSFKASWLNESFESGRFFVTYDVSSTNKVRIEIGDCQGNQALCGRSAHYATNFRQAVGSVEAIAVWGAVLAIGRVRGDLYFQLQDDAGTVLREDKMPVATLERVELEMRRLMATVEERQARWKDAC